ncbi:MAG: hypothetical protein V8Q30_12925 [Acutalibacteraceae bacterium]
MKRATVCQADGTAEPCPVIPGWRSADPDDSGGMRILFADGGGDHPALGRGTRSLPGR